MSLGFIFFILQEIDGHGISAKEQRKMERTLQNCLRPEINSCLFQPVSWKEIS